MAPEPGGRTEWLDLGARRASSGPFRWAIAVVVVLVLVGVMSLALQRREPVTAPEPGPSRPTPVLLPSATPPPPVPTARAPWPAPSSSIEVTRVGRPLLRSSAGWEIVGHAATSVVRIAPADGTITRTSVPAVPYRGPLRITAGRDLIIVRPTDGVEGYEVRDGMPARGLAEVFARTSFVFPGPDPDHLWTTAPPVGQSPNYRSTTIALVDLRGRPTGATLPTPQARRTSSLIPDGLGYLVSADSEGYYVARPDGLTKVTSGSLLAVGPTRWLVYECDEAGTCVLNVVDRADETRRRLAGPALRIWSPGLISPDGRFASVLTAEIDGQVRLQLVDLRTGARTTAAMAVGAKQAQVQAWTPDSRRLLMLDANGTLMVVDPSTGAARPLDAAIPSLSVITIRSTG